MSEAFNIAKSIELLEWYLQLPPKVQGYLIELIREEVESPEAYPFTEGFLHGTHEFATVFDFLSMKDDLSRIIRDLDTFIKHEWKTAPNGLKPILDELKKFGSTYLGVNDK